MLTSRRTLGPGIVLAGLALFTCLVGLAAGVKYDSKAKAEFGPIFTHVLTDYLGSKPGSNICLPPLFGFGDNATDIVVVNPDTEAQSPPVPASASRVLQFGALEAAGLVSRTESTRTINGRTIRSWSYQRTAKGLAVSQGPSLCYARGELNRVIKWKGPIALGEYQAAYVYYTVKTTHIEDWARSEDIQRAFPAVAPIVKGDDAKVRQVVIDLSSEGWDIAEYSKYVVLQ